MRRKNSTSRKSASNSKARAPDTSKVRFEALDEDHFKWVYVAYRKGLFGDFFPEGMSPSEFHDHLLYQIHEDLRIGREFVVGFNGSETPVLFVMITYGQHGRFAYPHAVWMPWSTPRIKWTVGYAFVKQLKERFRVLITCEERYVKYFDRLAKQGLLRRVGTLKDYMAPGEDGILYQDT